MAIVKGNDNSNILDFADGVTNNADTIFGLGGNDTILAFGGDDRIIGGLGSDYLNGGAGIDTADYVDSEQAVIVNLLTGLGAGGTAQGDTLLNIENIFGSGFDDLLIGDTGDNVLRGQGGDDTLKGGGGSDQLLGGLGNDTVSFYGWDDGINAMLAPNGIGFGHASHGATLHSIENLIGSNYGDILWGNSLDNRLTGRAGVDGLRGYGGDDVLEGGDHTDVLEGGDGDDILDGGEGQDTMIGGEGDDVYYVDARDDEVVEAAGEGSDTVYTAYSYGLPDENADVEYLICTANHMGRIALYGNASGNIIQGHNGGNAIHGGDGNDHLIGLGGEDFFVFTTPPNADSNMDEIVDFNIVEDMIVLDHPAFDALGDAVSIGEFVIGDAAQDADDHLIYDSDSGALYYDSDGLGTAEAIQFALLSPGLPLTYLDFDMGWGAPAA
jgi:Ca2+-binding RTX toxin-like protein